MASATKKLDQQSIDLLKSGTWTYDGDRTLFTMPMTQDKKLYSRVAAFLETAGGKWNRSAKATVFADGDAEVAVREACESGEYVDSKQLFQFFRTPETVASMMVQVLRMPNEQFTILEPSAGDGALVCAVAAGCLADEDPQMTLVEYDATKEKTLTELVGAPTQVGKRLVMRDFLQLRPTTGSDQLGLFDRVIMNPPFTRQQDIIHVRHAATFLKPGGRLVTIMSPAFTYRNDRRSQDFREWLEGPELSYHSVAELPVGSFKQSGTNVRTVMVTVQKS